MENQKQPSIAVNLYDILLYFVVQHQGDWMKVYKSIENKEQVSLEQCNAAKAKVTCKYTTILSDDYPEGLKHLPYPPYVLFYKGDLSLVTAPNRIAVVGARACSHYGLKMCHNIVADLLKRQFVIVSGLARGIDGQAHRTVVNNNGKTIAVVGQGLDLYYPPEHQSLYEDILKKGGLIISEYPEGVNPRPNNFPARNRIIAALSQGVVVVEAGKRSGALITVRHALQLGQEIYCVPERAGYDSGCNMLIKDGARLLESADEIDS